MTVSTMRLIDRFLGVPLCLLYALVLRLRKAQHHQGSITKNILIIKFFGLGSIILTTAALTVLKERFPQVKITYLSFSHHHELLSRFSCVDRVLLIDSASLRQFLRTTIAVIRILSLEKYDVVFDFEFFSKFSTLLSAMSNAPCRIGFALPTTWRTLLLTHQVPLTKLKHVTKAFVDQVSVITEPPSSISLLAPTISEYDRLALQAKINLTEGSIVTINVNAGDVFPERRWMPEQFASLVTRSMADTSCRYTFIGVAKERKYVQRVIDAISPNVHCYNLAGQISLGELCVLLQSSTLLISNDSGPLHLASVLGTPVIGLYGPETPDFYGPVSNSSRSIYKAISCSPCMNVYAAKQFRCPYNAECMRQISVDEVAAIVYEAMVIK